MIRVRNLTPHAIHLYLPDGDVQTIAPDPTPARVTAKPVVIAAIDGVPIRRTSFGVVTGLPEPEDGVMFIVSQLVASRCPDREDVVFPDDAVRDADGRVVGCRALGRV